jgi:hypothetical protein
MRNLPIALLMAASCLPAAQLPDNTITVTVTQGFAIQPDKMTIFVRVDTPLTGTLDDALAQVKGAGLTVADLNGVTTNFFNITWTFTPAVAFSKVKETIALLAKLSDASKDKNGSPALTFSMGSGFVSDEARAAQSCPLPSLISDARKQADSLAAAAGMKAGAIVSVSDGTSVDDQGSVPVSRSGQFQFVGQFSQLAVGDVLTGIPASVVLSQLFVSPFTTTATPSCLVTVQFKLQ